MARWRCNCPICRIFVHPVLRRLGGGLSEERVAERPIRRAPLTPEGEEEKHAPQESPEMAPSVTAEGAPQLQPVMAAPSISEEVIEGIVGKVVEGMRTVLEENTKVMVERLDRIEENMGKLRKELQGLVSSMENIIVEFREAISELSNPLVAPSNPQQPGSIAASPGTAQSFKASSNVLNFAKSIIGLVDKTDPRIIEEIIDEYKKVGILSDKEAEKLAAIVKTVSRLKEKGLDNNTIITIISSMLIE
ncbi:hypothetical protein PYJP_15630 [Pyrofollis japonicus]|uniref:hypothetical protein n=1 Tax=Pyrofollis japonicus TaxID=3060460 RepID=UPI00295BB826|nr:hypothetical protein [Pyrofollis japonicus]BEP18211.1 hypothetical protein PYJP_15630 [Pyrofollis japonicus]